MSNWIGDPLRPLNELEAYDAMRCFLESWFERGGRSEDQIAHVLGVTNRAYGLQSDPDQRVPLDSSMWDDWRDAVTTILANGSAPDRDPLSLD